MCVCIYLICLTVHQESVQQNTRSILGLPPMVSVILQNSIKPKVKTDTKTENVNNSKLAADKNKAEK